MFSGTFLAFRSDIRINNHVGCFLRPLPVFSCASLCSHQMLSGATVKIRTKPARWRQSPMCCSLRGGGKGKWGKVRAGKRQQYWKGQCQELHLMWGEQGPAPPPHWSVELSIIYVLCIIKRSGLFWKFLEAKKFYYFILFERGSHYVAHTGPLILLPQLPVFWDCRYTTPHFISEVLKKERKILCRNDHH